MASSEKNLSTWSGTNIKDLSNKTFAFVVSEYHGDITDALYSGAVDTLLEYGARKENILKKVVPGSFELTLGAQWLAADEKQMLLFALDVSSKVKPCTLILFVPQ